MSDDEIIITLNEIMRQTGVSKMESWINFSKWLKEVLKNREIRHKKEIKALLETVPLEDIKIDFEKVKKLEFYRDMGQHFDPSPMSSESGKVYGWGEHVKEVAKWQASWINANAHYFD